MTSHMKDKKDDDSKEHDLKPIPEGMPKLRQAADGHWYFPDPNRPGKFLRIK